MFDDVAVAVGDVLGAPPAGDIRLERRARAVVAKAQQLDGEPEIGPVAVDLVAVAVDVRARYGQAMLAQEQEERVLEVAQRGVGTERPTQLRDPGLCGLRARQASIS